jgi:hypothetical protein
MGPSGFAGLILCLAIFVLAAPASAPVLAAGLASGLSAAPATASAVELAQARPRRVYPKPKLKLKLKLKPKPKPKANLKKLLKRLKPPRRLADPSRPPPKPPRRTPGKPEPVPPRYAEDPRLPLLLLIPGLIPDLTPGQAEVLRSLPRRMQLPPQGGALPQRVAREILVLVDQRRPQSLGAQLAQAYGLELLSSRPVALLGARVELFRVRPGGSETVALAALQRDPRVRSAQFNWRYFHSGERGSEASPIPQYGPSKVHLPEAHKLALGRNVAIAIIDSQVDIGHPDLRGAVVRTFDAASGADPAPDFHGTAVAGIITSRGVVDGVAPAAAILAVRAFYTRPGALPETNTHTLFGAIDWAAGNGARVLNMSFVGPRDRGLEELLAAASRKGIVLVASAGNAGPRAPPAYPAAYPTVIAVTAVDATDRRYQHANRGRYIAIAAPGVDVLAPVAGGKHELLTGTSFATAYVSGIAALLLERDPSLDPATIARLISAAAADLGPAGRDDDFGAGLINAHAALALASTR